MVYGNGHEIVLGSFSVSISLSRKFKLLKKVEELDNFYKVQLKA